MSRSQRIAELHARTRHRSSITEDNLSKLYRRHGIRMTRTKVSLVSSANYEPDFLLAERADFCRRLTTQLKAGRLVLYLDQTTFRISDYPLRIWQRSEDPIHIKRPVVARDQTKRCIYGCIRSDDPQWLQWMDFDTTNTLNHGQFLLHLYARLGRPNVAARRRLIAQVDAHFENARLPVNNPRRRSLHECPLPELPEEPKDRWPLLVLDGHRSHDCRQARLYYRILRFAVDWTPPQSSALNPIETTWSLVKHQWRRRNLHFSATDMRRRNVHQQIRDLLARFAEAGTDLNDQMLRVPRSCYILYAEVLEAAGPNYPTDICRF